MPLDSEQRKQLEEKCKELATVYKRVKTYVIASEKIDKKQRLSLPAINELRNALDHEMRVKTVVLLDDTNGPEKADLVPFEYCLQNLGKAIGHVYRAGYDALDVVSMTLLDEVRMLLDGFRPSTLESCFPNYAQEIRRPLEKAMAKCDDAKANKDVESTDAGAQYFREYEEGVAGLRQLRKKLDAKLPELTAIEDEKSRDYCRQRNWAVGTAIITALAFLITLAMALAG